VSLAETVLAVHDLLTAGAAPGHAFGGALALAYYAEPRATEDIDINVFTPFSRAGSVVDRFSSIGFRAEKPEAEWVPPAAGVRLAGHNAPYKLDLFFSLDPLYDRARERVRRFAFGGRELPFLSAEDLTVFKLSFGRPKDWVDLRAMVAGGTDIDVEYVESQLIALRGPALYPRLTRLKAMLREKR
jgi:hypothetical protein